MLEEVLRHLKNWFLRPDGIHWGCYTVADGKLELPFLTRGAYFRIVGSLRNDGVYIYPAQGLTDETFTGAVWALAVPRAVEQLAAEIGTWQEKHGEVTACLSESFGGYSYQSAKNPVTGQPAAWQDVFRSRLNMWRRVRE